MCDYSTLWWFGHWAESIWGGAVPMCQPLLFWGVPLGLLVNKLNAQVEAVGWLALQDGKESDFVSILDYFTHGIFL